MTDAAVTPNARQEKRRFIPPLPPELPTARLPSALRLDSTELIEVTLEESSPKSADRRPPTAHYGLLLLFLLLLVLLPLPLDVELGLLAVAFHGAFAFEL